MTYKAHPDMHVGHAHLKVSDLERSIAFYRDVLGFDLQQQYGDSAAFMSAGGYHHHIGLNTWRSKGGGRPAPGTTGLFHVAYLYPDRPALARAVKNVVEAGVALDDASDHGVSQAIYFDDPDGNGIELYWDRDPADWPSGEDGEVQITTEPLDVQTLLAEA